jgi:hypothetical protein
MKIQSLSICVPGGCFNKCKFCVSRLHPNQAENLIEQEFEFADLHNKDYKDCMEFARDNGCNTLMFTGDGEPLMNRKFMQSVSDINNSLDMPFRWIELQTAGYKLQDQVDGRNKYLRWLRNMIRVKVISLSLSSMFSDDENALYNGTPENLKVNIEKTCSEIKRFGFTLRLSLNMTDFYNNKTPKEIFERAKKLGANQITFRQLYLSDQNQIEENHVVNTFILDHSCNPRTLNEIINYVVNYGRELELLPFGATKYSVDGMSVVVDVDCMSKETKNELKYLVLKQDCKLYSKWDDLGSVLF